MSISDNGFTPDDYHAKREDYFCVPRTEMLPYVPEECKKILDVGCGTGAFGYAIKQQRSVEVWGVEPDPVAATRATKNLDRVLRTTFSDDTELPRAEFDCVVFNDVLEHLLQPDRALALACALLRPDGCVVASIPNIGHFPTVWRLVMHGEWEYAERGILDKTHLRFYTRKSIRRLFEDAGFAINRIDGINPTLPMMPGDRRIWRYYSVLSWLPFSGVKDMGFLQFALRATIQRGGGGMNDPRVSVVVPSYNHAPI
jgi:SAM-dependent methyltransferase